MNLLENISLLEKSPTSSTTYYYFLTPVSLAVKAIHESV